MNEMNESTNLMEKALEYASMGFAVFPVCQRNKKPHTPNGCLDAKRDPGAIRFWWSKWPDASIGIATGSISNGLVVVDLDMDEDKDLDGYHELDKWERENGSMPESWRSITGRGGYHIFFKSNKIFSNRTRVLPGVDVRGEGGYIIAPPSIHPNGRRYEWEVAPEDMPLAEVDDVVEKLITFGLKDKETQKFELPATIENGTRNDILFRYACSLQSKGFPNDAILDYVQLTNKTRCPDPLTDEEIQTLVESALGYEKGAMVKPSFSGWHEPNITKHEVKKYGEIFEVADQTIENCFEAIAYDRELFGKIKYNEMAYDTVVYGSLPWDERAAIREWNNADDSNILMYLEKNYGLKNAEKIMNALSIVANKRKINPVKDMLEQVHKDYVASGSPKGKIKELLPHCLGSNDTEYTYEVMKVFMLGAISRAYHPGCKFDYTPIIVGEQGCGKSTFLRYLAMNDAWFTDNFNTLETDRAAEKLRGMWMLEMAELLAAKRTKDVEGIKSFLTSTEDSFRPPYQRRTEQRKRMCVFAGTTNNERFLTDRTGNRRFLPIATNKAKAKILHEKPETIKERIRLAWGEAMQIFKDAGEYPSLVLPARIQKIAEEMQTSFTEEDARVGIIQAWLDKNDSDRTCAIEIWNKALGIDKVPTRADMNAIHEIMTFQIDGWARHDGNGGKARCGAYGRQICYERISDQMKMFPEDEKTPFD